MVSVPQGEVGRSLLAGVFPKLRVLFILLEASVLRKKKHRSTPPSGGLFLKSRTERGA